MSVIVLPLAKEKKITIAFDTWTLNSLFRNQGTFVYSKQILAQFRQLAVQSAIEIRPYVSAATRNEANALLPAPGFQPRTSRLLGFDRLWRYGGGWLATCLGNPDVIFSPSFHTMQFPSRAIKVVTIHDVTPAVMPDFAPVNIIRKLQFTLRSAVRVSDGIIASSEHSKLDLMNVYGVPESKVSVVYLGYDSVHFNDTAPPAELLGSLLSHFKINWPFVFHHGLMQPRKNLKRLIQAHRLLLSRRVDLALDLVLAGPLGWKGEELRESARTSAGPRGDVIFTGALSDVDLAVLLKGAKLAVIPSLYEGFCLPLVESMACGVPTIAANSSCIPEISNGVLRYFHPESVDDMAACMEEAIENQALRRELSERGRGRADQFDWRRCAEQTLTILAQAAGRGRGV
jgi:glycosyltransferase involved in cell wall biosynthesis